MLISPPAVGTRRCLDAAKLLKHEATKVALAFIDGPETVEHNTEIINDFVKVAVLLTGFVREGCAGEHAGPTLVKVLNEYVSQVRQRSVGISSLFHDKKADMDEWMSWSMDRWIAARQVVGSARALVRAVGENNTAMLARSAGMVMERCDQLARAPFDSRAAVIR